MRKNKRTRAHVFKPFLLFIAVPLMLLFLSCGRDNGTATSGGENTGTSNTGSSDTGGSDTGGSDTGTSNTVQSVTCPADTAAVSMKDQTFNPQSITVPVNTVVKWTNNDPATGPNWWVTSGDVPENGSFSIPPFGPGKSECLKFTAPGTYNYHCDPEVQGVVIVE